MTMRITSISVAVAVSVVTSSACTESQFESTSDEAGFAVSVHESDGIVTAVFALPGEALELATVDGWSDDLSNSVSLVHRQGPREAKLVTTVDEIASGTVDLDKALGTISADLRDGMQRWLDTEAQLPAHTHTLAEVIIRGGNDYLYSEHECYLDCKDVGYPASICFCECYGLLCP